MPSTLTTTAPALPQNGHVATARPYFRLSVQQYHAMIASGILTTNDRVELLEGLLVAKMPQNAPHGSTISRTLKPLLRHLPAGWTLRLQSAVTLSDSEPEPDFAVVRGSEHTYDNRKPTAKDVALLMEVAESSLQEDRQVKGPLYARERIPEYWIVNLIDHHIEVYTGPRGGKSPGYRKQKNYGRDEVIPLALDGQVIAQLPVGDLLPVGSPGGR